jgi:hypothetical protein
MEFVERADDRAEQSSIARDGADRRHIDWQVDGRIGRLRAVRQRLSLAAQPSRSVFHVGFGPCRANVKLPTECDEDPVGATILPEIGGVQPNMRLSRAARWASWSVAGVASLLALTLNDLPAQTGQAAAQGQQAPKAVLDLQRTHDQARERREQVTHLLADAFVEIQADGRMLTRTQAIEKYTRFDDVSSASLTERRTASYGDVAIIAGRTGEEGTPYSARRLYVWLHVSGSWRLLVFQKTFMRPRTAKLSPLSAEWPAEYRNGQPGPAEEQTFATGDPVLLRGLLADDSILIDGYGDQFTGRAWLAQLNETKDPPSNVRDLSLLYQGQAAVLIGHAVSAPNSLASRFTRVWTPSPQGMQLRISQTTPAAAEVFGRER